MKILGIETSCDETAAAVVENGHKILSNVVVSQIDIFAAYGGVIPEVAARSHLEAIMPVIDKALTDAKTSWDDIDAIAVTYAPGLLGSLLIGTLTARTLAILHNKPLYAIHHLKSHVYANWLGREKALENTLFREPSRQRERTERSCPVTTGAASVPEKDVFQEPSFPLIALVVSGGHTQILFMPGHNRFEIIGTTRDDAVGECFDKVAKILGLPYPGGPAIAQATKKGDPNRYHLPIPQVNGLDFSFSGLKTAVLRAVQKAVDRPISFPSHQLAALLTPGQVADFAASFQKTAVKILVGKLKKAAIEHPEVKSIVLAGGVAANEELRKATVEAFSNRGGEGYQTEVPTAQRDSEAPQKAKTVSKTSQKFDLPVFFPELSLSGDNGAMVGAAAYYEILSGTKPADPFKLNIYPRISVEEKARA